MFRNIGFISLVCLSVASCSLVSSVVDNSIPDTPSCKPDRVIKDNRISFTLTESCYKEWEVYTSRIKALERDLQIVSNELKDRLKNDKE